MGNLEGLDVERRENFYLFSTHSSSQGSARRRRMLRCHGTTCREGLRRLSGALLPLRRPAEQARIGAAGAAVAALK